MGGLHPHHSAVFLKEFFHQGLGKEDSAPGEKLFHQMGHGSGHGGTLHAVPVGSDIVGHAGGGADFKLNRPLFQPLNGVAGLVDPRTEDASVDTGVVVPVHGVGENFVLVGLDHGLTQHRAFAGKQTPGHHGVSAGSLLLFDDHDPLCPVFKGADSRRDAGAAAADDNHIGSHFAAFGKLCTGQFGNTAVHKINGRRPLIFAGPGPVFPHLIHGDHSFPLYFDSLYQVLFSLCLSSWTNTLGFRCHFCSNGKNTLSISVHFPQSSPAPPLTAPRPVC